MLLHRMLCAAIVIMAVGGFGESAQADEIGANGVVVGGVFAYKLNGGGDAKEGDYSLKFGAGIRDQNNENRAGFADQLKGLPFAEYRHSDNSEQFTSFLSPKDNPWVCLTIDGQRKCGWLKELNLQQPPPPNLVPQPDPLPQPPSKTPLPDKIK